MSHGEFQFMFPRACHKYQGWTWTFPDKFSPVFFLQPLGTQIFPQGLLSLMAPSCTVPLLGLCPHSLGQGVVQGEFCNTEQHEEAGSWPKGEHRTLRSELLPGKSVCQPPGRQRPRQGVKLSPSHCVALVSSLYISETISFLTEKMKRTSIPRVLWGLHEVTWNGRTWSLQRFCKR